jgi:multidrug efflux pump
MVQLVTRGLLLDTMRVDTSDEEIEIRVRVPEKDRLLSTLDTLRVQTTSGQIPLSNFINVKPVPKLGQINRSDQQRYFDVKADVSGDLNAASEIAAVTEWLETKTPLPAGIRWEWKGDQEEQAESQAFLGVAFLGALGLMFVILLAQFNSFYNSILVLLAVVLSTTGVLIGMLVMAQPFSIIMTGTGIVALAGIVVNNNIVLIDTYQEYCRRMPRLDAIARTAEARIRPVLLTTITTMAGLAPMMFGISINFAEGGYSIDAPTALWWKQLASAVVFGLGVATVLTLVFTPSMLALRVWIFDGRKGKSDRFWEVVEVPDEPDEDLDYHAASEPTSVPAVTDTSPLGDAVKKAKEVLVETQASGQVNQAKPQRRKTKPVKAAE